MEKITGIKIKWDVVPSSQYKTVMQTRLSSGTNLPDIIDMPVDTYKYGKDGLIIPLDDLIKKYGFYATIAFKKKPFLPALMKTPDGVTYHLSGARDEEIAAGPYGWLIRKDWLDKLKLSEPKTIDDWYNILKAFKENDPNGNGQPDEIPITNNYGIAQMFNWGNAWGLHLRFSKGFYPDKDGKIQYEWLEPRAKEVIVFLNKLYSEGLYDKECAINTSEQQLSKVVRNLAGSAIEWQESTTMWNNKLKESGVNDANWIMTNIPSGPNGYQGHIETIGYANGMVSISKDCKNPEVAFRWLDFVIYSSESVKLRTVGIEGISYTVENGEIKMTDFVLKNPDGLGPVEAIRSIGAWQYFPMVLSAELTGKLKLSNPLHKERAKSIEKQIVPRVEFAINTDEEFTKINRKLTDISTYRDEMITKFIIGEEPIENWDKFTGMLKSMGIDEILQVRQTQYDRLQSYAKEYGYR
ncbi:MAG: extracellular solute-binding protein [Firmicutes bacterium]|nr:extracellular solute-binding protein [Bacillota bacterium]